MSKDVFCDDFSDLLSRHFGGKTCAAAFIVAEGGRIKIYSHVSPDLNKNQPRRNYFATEAMIAIRRECNEGADE
jgi:hypothetical protein